MSKNSSRALVSQLMEWIPTTKRGKNTLEKTENKSTERTFSKNRNTYGKNSN